MDRNIVRTLTAFLTALALYFFLDFFTLTVAHESAIAAIRATAFILGAVVLAILYKMTRNGGLLQ